MWCHIGVTWVQLTWQHTVLTWEWPISCPYEVNVQDISDFPLQYLTLVSYEARMINSYGMHIWLPFNITWAKVKCGTYGNLTFTTYTMTYEWHMGATRPVFAGYALINIPQEVFSKHNHASSQTTGNAKACQARYTRVTTILQVQEWNSLTVHLCLPCTGVAR